MTDGCAEGVAHGMRPMRPNTTDSCTEPPHKSPHVQPERLDTILRRLGLTPDVEDRLRTLELALACVAQDLANEIGHRLDLKQRIQEMEVSLGRLRTRR